MQELINKIKDAAGITEEQAIKALETVKDHVKSALPPGLSGMVDNFLSAPAPAKKDDAEDFLA